MSWSTRTSRPAYAIKVCATAAPIVCPIQASSIAIVAEKYYAIATSNLLASIETTVFTDTPNPSDTGAQVRVYHLSSDTPAVDALTAAGGDIGPALDNLPERDRLPHTPRPRSDLVEIDPWRRSTYL